MGAELSLRLGQTIQLESGEILRARVTEKVKKVVRGVSRHEAIHAVIGVVRGRWVRRVTNVPGPGYEGLTELDAYDRAAFMGPHVANEDGTGHDVGVADLRNDRHAGAAEAAPILSSHDEEINAVGEGLEEHGTLGHDGVLSYMEVGRRRKLRIVSIILELVRPDGKTVEKKTEARQGKVVVPKDLIPGVWEDLPQTA